MTSTFRSPIFELGDTYTTEGEKLSPIALTFLGKNDLDDQLDDFSLAGSVKKLEHIRSGLERLSKLEPIDEIDRIARDVMQERLSTQLLLAEAHDPQNRWAVLFSPGTSIRQVFEVMKYETPAQIANITARMNAVDGALKSWISCISDLAKMGKVNTVRQTQTVAKQLATFSDGAFTGLAKRFDSAGKYPELHAAGSAADKAAGETSQWLINHYLPMATQKDGVGEERYARWVRFYTGATLDLRATYEWGLADLAQINERMWQVAERIKPGAQTLREVADHLDADPKYAVHGADEMLHRLRKFTDDAVAAMDGIHFDIDERIRFCDVKLAPLGSAAAPYYQRPSEDFSRPGTTWFPTLGKSEFTWWQMPTIWYHEAVPGHHLQIASTVLEHERISRFQRLEGWVSGLSEGWALYAERFVDELGVYTDPGEEMGMLSAQAMRAARVVVDIGMHLGYKDPEGNLWSAESAVQLMINKALLDEEFARSEIDRYLGVPAQAISYKVGEKFWLDARTEAKQRLGDKFSLKKFHAYAFRQGPMGLDPFKAEIAKWDGN